jgi:TonB family protein
MASTAQKTMRHAWMILVLSVLVWPVPVAMAQQPSGALPQVIQHAQPIYPPLARQTRIDGEVRVKFTTDGESVLDVASESGHPLLRTAAEDNVRTWKFVAHTPGTFLVTFRYKFATDATEVSFLESPAIVQLEAPTPIVGGIVWGWLDLGTWKAQLSSAHGKTWQIFSLSYSGPNKDWLDGNAVGPTGKKEEIDFGHKEGDFLAFTITLREPGGQHIKTFFIGRMSKYKIVGTFIDNAGITGEWTGVRLADKPKS